MRRSALLTSLAIISLTAATFGYQIMSSRNTTFEASTSAVHQMIVQISNQQFTVELAKTEEEKATGLSNRRSLVANQGMLFIFEQSTKPSFWMRAMEFDLDIIWIDQQLTVVGVNRNVPAPKPGTSDDALPLYQPKEDILYVLEVPAGAAALIGEGEKVTISDIKKI